MDECSLLFMSVHVLTCYFKPKMDQELRASIQTMAWYLHTIFKTAANSRVIVMGDFNSHIKEVQALLARYKLQPSFSPQQTHSRGNCLDMVFSNIPVSSFEIIPTKISDHKALLVTLDLSVTDKDINVKNPGFYYTQADLRKAMNSADVLKEMKQNYRFEEAASHRFNSFVKKRKKSFKFFVHPPRWFLLKGKADTFSWA